MLQEVYQKGAILVKEEYQHNLSCTCVDSFGFFWWWWSWMLPVETLSCWFWFEVMTPRLISSYHSCQELILFPGIALQMINTVGGSRLPSIQSRSLSLRLCHFCSPKKGSEEQIIYLRQRRQAVHADLVHNAAPGILRDSHSPPCVAVGQVPQQPGPILLTYRYWFLFLGLQLISFWMPLI